MSANVRGGHRIQQLLETARRYYGVDFVEIGFFADARYPDGKPVAMVAAQNEYGVEGHIPERPFFREGIAASEEPVTDLLASQMSGETLAVTPALANRIGMLVAAAIQQRIVDLREPPNAPATINRKGSSNPLIDTGNMRTSVSWRIE